MQVNADQVTDAAFIRILHIVTLQRLTSEAVLRVIDFTVQRTQQT